MVEYSTFPKAPGLLSHHQMRFCVVFKTLVVTREVLLLRRDSVGVLHHPSQLNLFGGEWDLNLMTNYASRKSLRRPELDRYSTCYQSIESIYFVNVVFVLL